MPFLTSDSATVLYSLAATEHVATEGGLALLRLVLLAVAVCVGTVLLLLGGRLARPGCAGLGLALGAAGGLAWSGQAGGGTTMAVIGGAIGGFLIGLVFFKVWVGVGFAVLLAVAVPTASLMWEGVPLPVGGEVSRGGLADVEGSYRDRLEAVYEGHAPVVRAWWDDLGPITHRTMVVTASIMAVLGLLTGLIYPNQSVSILLALVGSLLVLVGLDSLFTILSPASPVWPAGEGRVAVVTVGLITLVGAAAQWTVLNPKADR